MSGPRRRLVVEADGGSRGNPGPAAYGTLVREADSGEVLAEDARTIGTTTNNVAEYRGLIAGLMLVQAIDPDAAVEVRMDSKLVVEQMAGRWRIKHPDLQPLAAEARSVLPAGQARWTWVPREQNRRADALANAALDGRVDEVIEHPLPAGVVGGAVPGGYRRRSPGASPGAVPGGPAGDPVPGRDAEVSTATDLGAVEPALPVEPDPELGARPPVLRSRQAAGSAGHPSAGHGSTGHGSAVYDAAGHEHDALFAADPAPASMARDDRVEPSTATTLLFLRHARTPDNVGHRFSGPRGTDPGLDETGRAQALAVGRVLTVFDVVVSSPMRRTMQTARVLAGESDLPVTAMEELIEYDSGDWDGLTDVQAAARDPALYAAWLLSPDIAPPNGESVRAVSFRVQTAVRRLVEQHRGQTVVVVSHAVPIACALLEALEAPLSSAPRLTIRNTSLTRMRYRPDGPPELDTILLPPGVPLPD